MSRVAYVDGAYVPLCEASVHVEDRGFQFADGIYEVWAVREGQLADRDGHFARLRRSLDAIRIVGAPQESALAVVLREVIRRNRVKEGLAYLQITRGAAPRDHVFPSPRRPTVVALARAMNQSALTARAEQGVRVITAPDLRWKRCDIKSIALLPNVLARQAAKEAGAFEAWLVDEDGFVTEGSATNAWIVTREGVLITRDLNNCILHGITRDGVLQAARALQIRVQERAFSVEEAKTAAEAFLTSATAAVTPVVRIDDAVIAAGAPGPMAKRLRAAYFDRIRSVK